MRDDKTVDSTDTEKKKQYSQQVYAHKLDSLIKTDKSLKRLTTK